MSEAIGLRERKKRERRQRIEDVALELFEQHGFDAITIQQIAAAADIAPRTFFSYFDSKDDVVLGDYADRLDRIVDELDQRPTDEPAWSALKGAFAAVALDYKAEAERLGRRFRIMASTPSVHARSLQLQAGWEDTLTAHLAARSGAPSRDPEPRLIAAAAVAIMRASLEHWLNAPQAAELPTLVQRAFDRLDVDLIKPDP